MSGKPGTALGRYLKTKVTNDLAKSVITGLDIFAESQLQNFLPDLPEDGKGPLSDDEVRIAAAVLEQIDLPDIDGPDEAKAKRHLVKALYHLEKVRELYVKQA